MGGGGRRKLPCHIPRVSRGSRIEELEILRVHGVDGTRAPLQSDSPWFDSHVPLLSDRAKDRLEDLLVGCAELLPAQLDEQRLWLANVTAMPNRLDYEASSYEVWEADRGIRRFHEYQFIEEAVRGLDIFRLSDTPAYSPFVSDRFVERVAECGLAGMDFELVWDSELPRGSIVFRGLCA